MDSHQKKNIFGNFQINSNLFNLSFGIASQSNAQIQNFGGISKSHTNLLQQSFEIPKKNCNAQQQSFGFSKTYSDQQKQNFGFAKSYSDLQNESFEFGKSNSHQQKQSFGIAKNHSDQQKQNFGITKNHSDQQKFKGDNKRKKQIFRIVKGEIGPNNLTEKECIKMMQTIENREKHKDIIGNLYDPNSYDTLRYSNQDYQLNQQQQQILEQAWSKKDVVSNEGYLGWATSPTAIKSNQFYYWIADKYKTGQHFYYHAQKKK